MKKPILTKTLTIIITLFALISYETSAISGKVPSDLYEYYYSGKYDEVGHILKETADSPLKQLLQTQTSLKKQKGPVKTPIPNQLFSDKDLTIFHTWLSFKKALHNHNITKANTLFSKIQLSHHDTFIIHKMRLALANYYYKTKKYTAMNLMITPLLEDEKITRFFPEALALQIKTKLIINEPDQAFSLYANYIKLFPHKDLNRDIFNEIKKSKPEKYHFNHLFKSDQDQLNYIKELYSRTRLQSVKREAYRFLKQTPSKKHREETLYILGKTYYKHYEFKRAISILKRCAHHFDLNKNQKAESYYFLAKAYNKIQKKRKRNYYYAQLIKKYPNYTYLPSAYYALCSAYKRSGYTILYNRYEKAFKKRFGHTESYSKLHWTNQWDQLIKIAKSKKKTKLLKEFKKLINNKKLADKILTVYENIYPQHLYALKKGIVSAPIDYETFQLMSRYHQPSENPTEKRQFIQKYQDLFALGCGEIALEEMRFIDFMTTQNTPDFLYTKISLAQSIYEYNQGLSIAFQTKLFRKKAFSAISQSFTPLFYPKVYWNDVQEQGKRYKIDPFLILAVMREESHFNPQATSKSNAMGLMQIMGPTGKDIARRLKEPWNGTSVLFIPEKNIQFGSYYLSYLKNRFNGTLHYLISGYNAGPGRTNRWIKKFGTYDTTQFLQQLPYGETRDYVKRVLGSYLIYTFLYT